VIPARPFQILQRLRRSWPTSQASARRASAAVDRQPINPRGEDTGCVVRVTRGLVNCPAICSWVCGALLGSIFKDHWVVDHGEVIRRHELTAQEWELLAPLIPRAATGRPRVPDRQVINGMVYKIRTGISWRDLPERYGPWQTVYTRFRRYALDGVFTRALQQIQARADAAGDIDWLVQIDSTIVRAHQHSAATGRKGGSAGRTNRTITPSVDPEAD